MKNSLVICCLCAVTLLAGGQQHATFDDLVLEPGSFYNGSDSKGGFYSGGFWFPNSFDTEWDSWMGFSVSNMKDTITAGYNNQYSAITAGGVNGSDNYAVAYVGGELEFNLQDTAVISGFYITNSTFAYLSLKDGDDFSKKFGGTDGNDPDYFKLIITGIDAEGGQTGVEEFFLADFTSVDPDGDYIVNTWKWVDLTSLGEVVSLKFTMESTDMASWGMNTPSYFCLDNFNYPRTVVSEEVYGGYGELRVYPNPVQDIFHAELPAGVEEIIIAGPDGKLIVKREIYEKKVIQISALSGMPAGTYFLYVKSRETILVSKLMKL